MKQQPEAANNQPNSHGRGESAGMDLGLRVLSYLISGVLLYGLLGWVGDHYLGTEFLLPIGIVGGAAFGAYVIIRRFGRIDDGTAGANHDSSRARVTERRHKAE